MPRTLLARTFLLLTLLVVLTTSAWLAVFHYIGSEPRARETGRLVASTVNLVRVAIFAADPDKRPMLFAELSKREGIRLLPVEGRERLEPLPDGRFFRLVDRELRQRLGPQTRLAEAVDGTEGFWISFRLAEEDEDEYWLILPTERLANDSLGQWLLWAPLALALALLVAALIASWWSRPLKRLAESAAQLGRGERPAPLPESGPLELCHLATAFNHMADDLRRMESDRAEVLAGISHDLRTPLTRLRLETEMSMPDAGAREAAIADIEQMDLVLSQFMDYARADLGETPVRLDLGDLLQPLIDAERARGRTVNGDFAADLGPLMVRARALTRAVRNLLDNAWKYGAHCVEISVQAEPGFVEIRVADDGPGIPAGQEERLKQPFARLDDARSNVTGTGLGLAIAERIARAHGGGLRLENRPQGGLLVGLRLLRE